MRTQKTYIHTLPNLEKKPVELFLDIEGIPDEQTYYLIGLLVRKHEGEMFYSFWADTSEHEKVMWEQFLEKIRAYTHAPIYHYGNYDHKAIEVLAKRYETNIDSLKTRLCNLITHIYGKIYFPTRSNSLKDIGKFLGAFWTHPQASGIQSLIWRHYWNTTHHVRFQAQLITYNREDCYALSHVVEELYRIKDSANTLSEVDFANHPKQYSTEIGQTVHQEFETILQLAHKKYDQRKISFQELRDKNEQPDKRARFGLKKGYQGQRKVRPKPTKVIDISPLTTCPDCGETLIQKKPFPVSRLIIDLVLTRNGIRKTITEYISEKRFCRTCQKWYNPKEINKYGKSQLYGHHFKAWVVYLRVTHRLPYPRIAEIAHDQFSMDISWPYLSSYMYGLKKRHLAKFKTSVEQFYNTVIDDKIYRSEVTQKYQKRFKRYEDSLFTFLEHDGVAWHNNTAERALRHLTKQEQISGNFHETLTHDYLVLLGIKQTCRFHKKSFFKFLFSDQRNIGHF